MVRVGHVWYHSCPMLVPLLVVSTNLRLTDEMVVALREASASSGRSQQEIVRAAIAKELGLAPASSALARAVQSGLVKAPTPFQEVVEAVRLPDGVTTLDLLDRDDR